eukprot:scaffold121986_cov48-Prasinocladus_malaysianus.AAC.3
MNACAPPPAANGETHEGDTSPRGRCVGRFYHRLLALSSATGQTHTARRRASGRQVGLAKCQRIKTLKIGTLQNKRVGYHESIR